MLPRSELVSQWQERLASAEQLAGATTRFRWFHAARTRLYRFLLSCYGGGHWRSDLEGETGQIPSGVVAVDDELSLLAGKPPKSAGKIQAVLKAVHNAQDYEPIAGPLVGGLDPSVYMAVTASDARIDVEKCERFLLDRGFHARVVGRRMTVEVPYDELRQAEALVDIHRERLRPVLKTQIAKLRQNPPLPEETQMLVVGLVLIAPVVGLAALCLGAIVMKEQLNSGQGYGNLLGLFFGAFVAVAEISLLWYFVGPRWRLALSLTARRRIAMGVFWTCIGVPAALIAAAAIDELQSNRDFQVISSIHPGIVIATLIALIAVIAIAVDHYRRRGAG